MNTQSSTASDRAARPAPDFQRSSPKRPNHSIEAELSTLGGLILNSNAWSDVSAIVRENDFHEEKNRVIFSAIRDLATAGKPLDPVSLIDRLEHTGQLADAGGATWIGQVGRDTPSAANVIHYAQIVRRKALERQRAAAIERDDHHRAADLTAAIDALEAGTSADTLLADYVPVSSLDGQSFTRTYLVEGLIEQGRLYEFFGKYKEGKTLAVIDMVANMSIARTWANRRTAQALVVWVAGEAVDDVQMRIAAWRLHHGITDPMPFYIRVKPVYMTDQAFAARLAKEIEALKKQHPGLPVVLVLDTVARCMAPGADENSITGLGAFANNLLDIVVRPLNATTICVHHSGHGDSDRGRGHSSFEGAVDGTIKVSMDRSSGQPVITVAASRIRSTAGDDSLSFRIEVQELPGEDNFGNPIDAPVLRYLTDYKPAQRPTGKNERQALVILEQLLATTPTTFTSNVVAGHAATQPTTNYNIPYPSVLVTEWRTAFKAWVIGGSNQTEDSVVANNKANIAWRRVERSLHEKGITRYDGINNTRVSLAQVEEGIQ